MIIVLIFLLQRGRLREDRLEQAALQPLYEQLQARRRQAHGAGQGRHVQLSNQGNQDLGMFKIDHNFTTFDVVTFENIVKISLTTAF